MPALKDRPKAKAAPLTEQHSAHFGCNGIDYITDTTKTTGDWYDIKAWDGDAVIANLVGNNEGAAAAAKIITLTGTLLNGDTLPNGLGWKSITLTSGKLICYRR
jgi:hypothetical protein